MLNTSTSSFYAACVDKWRCRIVCTNAAFLDPSTAIAVVNSSHFVAVVVLSFLVDEPFTKDSCTCVWSAARPFACAATLHSWTWAAYISAKACSLFIPWCRWDSCSNESALHTRCLVSALRRAPSRVCISKPRAQNSGLDEISISISMSCTVALMSLRIRLNSSGVYQYDFLSCIVKLLICGVRRALTFSQKVTLRGNDNVDDWDGVSSVMVIASNRFWTGSFDLRLQKSTFANAGCQSQKMKQDKSRVLLAESILSKKAEKVLIRKDTRQKLSWMYHRWWNLTYDPISNR